MGAPGLEMHGASLRGGICMTMIIVDIVDIALTLSLSTLLDIVDIVQTASESTRAFRSL